MQYLCAFALITAYLAYANPSSTCDIRVYGRLDVNDCFNLFKQLPAEPGIDPDEYRSFVEPKFTDPSFLPVMNPYHSQMVQLPKIWRGEGCRYALMSIADAAGTVHEPTSVDKWRTTLDAAVDIIQDCVLEKNGAGGMQYANINEEQAKVVYVYASGSPFENVMNKYMSSYHRGVSPTNPMAYLQISQDNSNTSAT